MPTKISENRAYMIISYICSVAFATDIEKVGVAPLYPLIKVYQNLPNGMEDDGTRSFLCKVDLCDRDSEKLVCHFGADQDLVYKLPNIAK